jgi:hypothetical protein
MDNLPWALVELQVLKLLRVALSEVLGLLWTALPYVGLPQHSFLKNARTCVSLSPVSLLSNGLLTRISSRS